MSLFWDVQPPRINNHHQNMTSPYLCGRFSELTRTDTSHLQVDRHLCGRSTDKFSQSARIFCSFDMLSSTLPKQSWSVCVHLTEVRVWRCSGCYEELALQDSDVCGCQWSIHKTDQVELCSSISLVTMLHQMQDQTKLIWMLARMGSWTFQHKQDKSLNGVAIVSS